MIMMRCSLWISFAIFYNLLVVRCVKTARRKHESANKVQDEDRGATASSSSSLWSEPVAYVRNWNPLPSNLERWDAELRQDGGMYYQSLESQEGGNPIRSPLDVFVPSTNILLRRLLRRHGAATLSEPGRAKPHITDSLHDTGYHQISGPTCRPTLKTDKALDEKGCFFTYDERNRTKTVGGDEFFVYDLETELGLDTYFDEAKSKYCVFDPDCENNLSYSWLKVVLAFTCGIGTMEKPSKKNWFFGGWINRKFRIAASQDKSEKRSLCFDEQNVEQEIKDKRTISYNWPIFTSDRVVALFDHQDHVFSLQPHHRILALGDSNMRHFLFEDGPEVDCPGPFPVPIPAECSESGKQITIRPRHQGSVMFAGALQKDINEIRQTLRNLKLANDAYCKQNDLIGDENCLRDVVILLNRGAHPLLPTDPYHIAVRGTRIVWSKNSTFTYVNNNFENIYDTNLYELRQLLKVVRELFPTLTSPIIWRGTMALHPSKAHCEPKDIPCATRTAYLSAERSRKLERMQRQEIKANHKDVLYLDHWMPTYRRAFMHPQSDHCGDAVHYESELDQQMWKEATTSARTDAQHKNVDRTTSRSRSRSLDHSIVTGSSQEQQNYTRTTSFNLLVNNFYHQNYMGICDAKYCMHKKVRRLGSGGMKSVVEDGGSVEWMSTTPANRTIDVRKAFQNHNDEDEVHKPEDSTIPEVRPTRIKLLVGDNQQEDHDHVENDRAVFTRGLKKRSKNNSRLISSSLFFHSVI